MRFIIALLILMNTLSSCNEKVTITNEFNCNTPSHFTNTKAYKDVLSHFKLDIPKSWKTNLYFDEYRSEIYSADTTKQLTETYIADITWHQGELLFNEEFESKVHENLIEKEDLEIVRSGYGEFIDRKSYYLLSTGKNTEITYHYLQIYLQYNIDSYYTFTSKIYGDDFVNERLCASISLFKDIKFIQ